MLFGTVYGYMHGNIHRLLAPIDGNGNFCGINNDGHDLKAYPYLYFGNLLVDNPFTTAVCVKECPVDDNGHIGVLCDQSSALCKDSEAQYSSTSVFGICLPTSTKDLSSNLRTVYKTLKAKLMASAGGRVVSDILKAKVSIYISMATAFIYAFVLMYLLSAFAETIAYICIVLTGLGLFGGAALCWFMRADIIAERGDVGDGTAVQGDDLNDSETEAFWLLVGCIGLAALGCCFCVCVVCGWKHVKHAVDVIDAAADFAVENKRVIGVPVFYFVLTVISFLVWLYSFACVVSLNKIESPSQSGVSMGKFIPQDRVIEWTGPLGAAAAGMFFGILWIMAWWNYSAKFVVMAAATTYYFNSGGDEAAAKALQEKGLQNPETGDGQAELLYSFKLAHIYHTGSIAAGAFIIALIEFIKFLFLYLAKKAEKASGGSKVIKAVVYVAECILSCIEKICDYVNQSAFAYIAITGDGFCEGAWKGFLLNVKHMLEFTFANYIAKIFILLGKVALVVVNCFTLVFIMKAATGVADQMHSIWGPVAVTGLISWIAASLFLGIFENAVLALMTCLAVDMDQHDGTPEYGPATFHDKIEKVKDGVHGTDVHDEDEDDQKANKMA